MMQYLHTAALQILYFAPHTEQGYLCECLKAPDESLGAFAFHLQVGWKVIDVALHLEPVQFIGVAGFFVG